MRPIPCCAPVVAGRCGSSPSLTRARSWRRSSPTSDSGLRTPIALLNPPQNNWTAAFRRFGRPAAARIAGPPRQALKSVYVQARLDPVLPRGLSPGAPSRLPQAAFALTPPGAVSDAPGRLVSSSGRERPGGVLAWTRIRVTNGALEGMNNKVKAISDRAFGYRMTWTYIANIYHCCAGLPLP
jgi:hypothetical protein